MGCLSCSAFVLRSIFGLGSESTLARRARQAKFSHALVWPLDLGLRTPTLQCGHLSGPSRTRGGFVDFEVGGHDGAHKGRVHVIVPVVGRKNGNLIDRQQPYNVLGSWAGGGSAVWGLSIVIDGRNIHLDAGRAGQTYPLSHLLN